jgi:hypothetical protein
MHGKARLAQVQLHHVGDGRVVLDKEQLPVHPASVG